METLKTNTFTLGLSLAAIVAIEVTAYLLDFQEKSPVLLYLGGVRIIEIGILATIFHRWSGGIGLIIPGKKNIVKHLWRAFAWSAACGIIIVALSLIVKALDPNLWYRFAPGTDQPPASPWLLFVTGCLLSPIVEELLFRRIIFLFFRRWGFFVATLLSTTTFIFLHQSSSTFPWLPIIGGVLLALVYEKEKQLLAPILVHISANTLLMIVLP